MTVGKVQVRPVRPWLVNKKPRAKCFRIAAYAEISMEERYPMRVLIDAGAR